jgi:hypothetical protein
MLTHRNMVLAGTRAFATSSHPEDEVFTVVFNENVRTGLPGGLSFTQSPSVIEASLLRFVPGGMTALYDAVIDGLDHLQKATHQKKVLVRPERRRGQREHALEEGYAAPRAAQRRAHLHDLHRRPRITRGDRDVMKRLASMSGGVIYSPGSEMRSLPTSRRSRTTSAEATALVMCRLNPDGEYHRVKVTVRAPGFKNLSVRARDGYTAGDTTTD